MEVYKQLKFKSHQRMQVEFISNNVDVMTHAAQNLPDTIIWIPQKNAPELRYRTSASSNSSHDNIIILPEMRAADYSSFEILTKVFYTLFIGPKLCFFYIRSKRVLQISFVLILNIKIAGSNISFNTPQLSR